MATGYAKASGRLGVCLATSGPIAAADDSYGRPAPVLPQHGSTVLTRRFGVPDPEQVSAAAEVLNAAERPAVLAGVGALGARYEVFAVAQPGDLPAALRTTLAHDGPALVDVDIDPNEPLLLSTRWPGCSVPVFAASWWSARREVWSALSFPSGSAGCRREADSRWCWCCVP